MKAYIINKTCSEGFWYGNESWPFASSDMDEVIRDAYHSPVGYKATYEADSYKHDDEDEMLTFEEFAEIMKQGFKESSDQGLKTGYVVIQFSDYHCQFEPHIINI